MRECLDEGMIQSYADGELSLEMTEAVATHIAACGACAAAAREAESEITIMASAFAPEMSLGVPTARLRERLDAAISDLQPQTPVMTKSPGSRLRAWLSGLFAPLAFQPGQAVAFASLLAIVAFALIFSIIFLRRSGSEYAREAGMAAPVAFNVDELPLREVNEAPDSTTGTGGERIVKAKYPHKPARLRTQASREEATATTAKNNNPVPKQPAPVKDTLLPGERSYLTAIASLTTTLEAGGERALKPSLRAEYERNLAVVDQAIEATRHAARSNPNDGDAANFLLVAYQSKVDLLNTVADQARLSASAR